MEMKKELHLSGEDLLRMVQLKPGDIAPYTIIPGPVERLQAILKKIKNPVQNFAFMEYTMYTGTFGGTRVTVGNGGRYSADSAIIGEIVCAAGTESIIRTGSCGALGEDIAIGDLVIVTGVIRGDGVTPYYVPENYATVADFEVVSALVKAARAKGVRHHVGLVWTTDALLRETREIVERMRKIKVRAADMVSASLLTVAQLHEIRAGSILAVSDNVVTGELGFMDPNYHEAENTMIDIALEAVKLLEAH